MGQLTPFPGPPDRAGDLQAIMTAISQRWGIGSIVRLGDVHRAVTVAANPRPAALPELPELPPWWPAPDGRRPRILEVVSSLGNGALTLCLTWLAAARPTLSVVVDSQHRVQPTSIAYCGLDPSSVVIVHPPAASARLSFDACISFLRGGASDVVLCALPPDATDIRADSRLATHLASLAARSGSSLLLLSPPHPRRPTGVLGTAADFRVRTANHHWRWEYGQVTGPRLRVRIDRARAAKAIVGEEHDLVFAAPNPDGQLPSGQPPFHLHAANRFVPGGGHVNTMQDRPAALRVAESRAPR